jgi:SAM-dependent methyltransferase
VIDVDELRKIEERYAKRIRSPALAGCYDPLLPSVYLARQERERALIQLIKKAHLEPLGDRDVLEVGCGTGGTLKDLLGLGFSPDRLVGVELITERAVRARRNLPATVRILEGNVLAYDLPADSFDVVVQSTVFSSILDDRFQRDLAAFMWRVVKPGGGIIWYDFYL